MGLIKYGLVAVAFVFLLRNCDNFVGPSGLGPRTKGTWLKVETLSGDTDQKTYSYRSPSGKSRVRWQARNEKEKLGQFSVRARSPHGASIRKIADVTVRSGGSESGEWYLSNVPEYILEVRATVPWDLTVEVLQEVPR